MRERAVYLVNRHRPDWCLCRTGDVLNGDAVVDDDLIVAAAVDPDVIDDRGVVVDLRRLSRAGAIIPRM